MYIYLNIFIRDLLLRVFKERSCHFGVFHWGSSLLAFLHFNRCCSLASPLRLPLGLLVVNLPPFPLGRPVLRFTWGCWLWMLLFSG